MRGDVVATRVLVVSSVPPGGIALDRGPGLHVLGIEVQGAGDLVVTLPNPETPDTPDTIPTAANVFRAIVAERIEAATTALPLIVYWGPRR